MQSDHRQLSGRRPTVVSFQDKRTVHPDTRILTWDSKVFDILHRTSQGDVSTTRGIESRHEAWKQTGPSQLWRKERRSINSINHEPQTS